MNREVRRTCSRLLMGAWLMAVWLLLWGRFDAATVTGGAIVVTLAYAATRLPVVPLATRVRPMLLAAEALRFAGDLVTSSVVIARHALLSPRRVRGAIIEVDTRSRSELLLLAVTVSVTLRPGTLVLDVDARRSLLLVHGMPVRDRREADALRQAVHDTEHRLVRALPQLQDADEQCATPREPDPPDTREPTGEEER